MSKTVTQFTEVVYDPFLADQGFKNELNHKRDFRVSEGDKLCLCIGGNVASNVGRAGKKNDGQFAGVSWSRAGCGARNGSMQTVLPQCNLA